MAEDPKAPDLPGTIQMRPGEVLKPAPSAVMETVRAPATGSVAPPAPSSSMETIRAPSQASPIQSAPSVMPTLRPSAPAGIEPSASSVMSTLRSGENLVGGGPPALSDPAISLSFGAPPEMPKVRYEIGLEIARGGMGRVVEAQDTRLGRVVALKEALAMDDDSLRRFEREIRITARLEHPSIVPVHDAGSGPGGAPFYVMRKVEGRPLERLVATTDTLAERLALIPHIVASANAIAHAHERGVIHRDIKPSNILVGDLGETIVIDWGLAKVIGETEEHHAHEIQPAAVDDGDTIKTRAGIVYGTPGFMAPEQLRGAMPDERCDVYALGATLYHLLLRKPPHHAKTADEMMRAAVDGQATSLLALVDGVPPELSTIVDKSLAHDNTVRYQTARELASDLERFLKGQLIAAHRYSRKERVLRFWRKNKIPIVGISLAALAAIAIGIVSFARVVAARDRADDAADLARIAQHDAEHERQLAVDRADALTLANARSLLESNPTLAVAMVKRLAATKWQEVRAIGAGARFAGVAWRGEASPQTVSVALAADGHRVLSVGSDGVVRLYDLAKRTTAKVTDVHAALHARLADGDKRAVLYGGKQLVILDLASGTRQNVELPTAVTGPEALVVVDTSVYYADTTGNLWQLALGAAAPLQIATDEPIGTVFASPDKRWLALGATNHLLLFDRNAPTTPPAEVMFGKTRDVQWSADGARLVAQIDASIVDVLMTSEPLPRIVRRISVGDRFSVAFANGALFSLGLLGVETASTRSNMDPRKQFPAKDLGLYVARNDTIIAGTASSVFALAEDGDRQLFSPILIDSIDASPASSYVVATGDHSLLAWNLDDIQPTRLASDPTGAKFTGSDRVIATFDGAPAQWIDLATKHPSPLEISSPLRKVGGAPGGKIAVLIDTTHHARVVGLGHDDELEGQVDHASFIDDRHLMLSAPGGRVQLYDIDAKTRTVLVEHPGKVLTLSWNRVEPPTIAVGYEDGFLWREDLRTKQMTQLVLGKRLSGGIQVGPDGAVWFGMGPELRAWRDGATAVKVAAVPKPIVELGFAADRVVVFTDDGTAYVVDPAHPDAIPPLIALSNRAAMSALTGLIVTTRGPALDMIDPLVRARWTLGAANNETFSPPEISADGRHVIATVHGHLVTWQLDLPTSPDATAKWLDAMTNAYDKGTGDLGWR